MFSTDEEAIPLSASMSKVVVAKFDGIGVATYPQNQHLDDDGKARVHYAIGKTTFPFTRACACRLMFGFLWCCSVLERLSFRVLQPITFPVSAVFIAATCLFGCCVLPKLLKEMSEHQSDKNKIG